METNWTSRPTQQEAKWSQMDGPREAKWRQMDRVANTLGMHNLWKSEHDACWKTKESLSQT